MYLYGGGSFTERKLLLMKTIADNNFCSKRLLAV